MLLYFSLANTHCWIGRGESRGYIRAGFAIRRCGKTPVSSASHGVGDGMKRNVYASSLLSRVCSELHSKSAEVDCREGGSKQKGALPATSQLSTNSIM